MNLEAVCRAVPSGRAPVAVIWRLGGPDLPVDEGVEADIRSPTEATLAHRAVVLLQQSVRLTCDGDKKSLRCCCPAFHCYFIIFNSHKCSNNNGAQMNDAYRHWFRSQWGKSACCGHLSWAGCHQMWNKPHLGPPRQLPASGAELERNKSQESACHKHRILFIIARIITDTILLTVVATSDPGETGGAGELMGNSEPAFPGGHWHFSSFSALF